MKTLSFFGIFALVVMTYALGQVEAAENGLVGYWNFDEGDGDEVEDSSGTGNDGVFIGPIEWVEGKFGTALHFAQDQSCVRIEHSDSLDIAKEITIAVWAKPEASLPSWGKFLCKQKTGEYPYSLQYDDANAIFGTVHASARFDTSPKLENFAGEWAHLAFVYDGEAVILYKDGEEVGRTAASGDLQRNTEPVTIGSRLSSGQSFKGALDEVRIYSRALPQNEIQAIMNRSGMSVDSADKLAIAWGGIKRI